MKNTAYDKLSIRHKMFVKHYCNNGNNALQAYSKVYPDVTQNTAKVNGCKLLTDANIRLAVDCDMNKQLSLIDLKSITCKSSLILRTDRIAQKAEDSEKYDTALKGIDTIAKLTHAYADKKESNKYNTFVQNIYNSSNNSEFETIEVVDAPDTIDSPGSIGGSGVPSVPCDPVDPVDPG